MTVDLRSRTATVFGVRMHAVTLSEAVGCVHAWLANPDGQYRYVVTPNLDHVLMYEARADVRAAYADAALIVPDGTPLIWGSRWFGHGLRERVAGSDLVPAVFAAARSPVRTFLLGAAEGVADRAARKIEQRYPNIRVVGTHSPPMGFERNAEHNRAAIDAVRAAEPELLLLGLGAPKQELWIHGHRQELGVPVSLCVGATIDFLAEHKPRAPEWMQRSGLEWLHRACSEPRRLVPRYAKNALHLPRLFTREWQRSRTP